MNKVLLGNGLSLTAESVSPAATPDEIAKLESFLGFGLPEEYKRILSQANGFSGWTDAEDENDQHYVDLYGVTEVIETEREFRLRQLMPKTLVIGSSGGGQAYILQIEPTVSAPWIRAHFEEISPSNDRLELRYQTLSELFAHLGDSYVSVD